MKSTIYITRHAQRYDNNTIPGERVLLATRGEDPDITFLGEIQSIETGAELKKSGISVVYSSPFYRTMKTAVLIARQIGVKVRSEWGLSETFFFPEWPGTIPEEILKREFPEIESAKPTGIYPVLHQENDFWDTHERCRKTIMILAERHKGENILLVSHGFPLISLQTSLIGWSHPRCREHMNCGISEIRKEDDGPWQAIRLNDTSHLSQPTW